MIKTYPYNMIQWLLFFYCYCFLGWCIESTIVSFTKKRLVNRGFLHGPMLPIYGTGALMVLICTIPVKEHMALVYVCGMIGATILEYITGWGMEKLLKVRYWDYSNEVLNFNGYVCLKASLFWGFLSIFMTYVVHEPIAHIVLSIPRIVSEVLVCFISILFLSDVCISAKTAFDFARLLEKMQKLRTELDGLSERVKEEYMRAMKERSAEAIGSMVERSINVKENLRGLSDSAKEKQTLILEFLKDRSKETKAKIPDNWKKQEIAEQFYQLQEHTRKEIAERFQALQGEKSDLLKKLINRERKLIRRHPSAVSIRFKEVFEEVKTVIEEKNKKKRDE